MRWSGRRDTRSRVPIPVSSSLIGSDNGRLAIRCRTGAADYRRQVAGKQNDPNGSPLRLRNRPCDQTPTPANVSLGATTHSTPLPTVLPAHLFSVAWLLR